MVNVQQRLHRPLRSKKEKNCSESESLYLYTVYACRELNITCVRYECDGNSDRRSTICRQMTFNGINIIGPSASACYCTPQCVRLIAGVCTRGRFVKRRIGSIQCSR